MTFEQILILIWATPGVVLSTFDLDTLRVLLVLPWLVPVVAGLWKRKRDDE